MQCCFVAGTTHLLSFASSRTDKKKADALSRAQECVKLMGHMAVSWPAAVQSQRLLENLLKEYGMEDPNSGIVSYALSVADRRTRRRSCNKVTIHCPCPAFHLWTVLPHPTQLETKRSSRYQRSCLARPIFPRRSCQARTILCSYNSSSTRRKCSIRISLCIRNTRESILPSSLISATSTPSILPSTATGFHLAISTLACRRPTQTGTRTTLWCRTLCRTNTRRLCSTTSCCRTWSKARLATHRLEDEYVCIRCILVSCATSPVCADGPEPMLQ